MRRIAMYPNSRFKDLGKQTNIRVVLTHSRRSRGRLSQYTLETKPMEIPFRSHPIRDRCAYTTMHLTPRTFNGFSILTRPSGGKS